MAARVLALSLPVQFSLLANSFLHFINFSCFQNSFQKVAFNARTKFTLRPNPLHYHRHHHDHHDHRDHHPGRRLPTTTPTHCSTTISTLFASNPVGLKPFALSPLRFKQIHSNLFHHRFPLFSFFSNFSGSHLLSLARAHTGRHLSQVQPVECFVVRATHNVDRTGISNCYANNFKRSCTHSHTLLRSSSSFPSPFPILCNEKQIKAKFRVLRFAKHIRYQASTLFRCRHLCPPLFNLWPFSASTRWAQFDVYVPRSFTVFSAAQMVRIRFFSMCLLSFWRQIGHLHLHSLETRAFRAHLL